MILQRFTNKHFPTPPTNIRAVCATMTTSTCNPATHHHPAPLMISSRTWISLAPHKIITENPPAFPWRNTVQASGPGQERQDWNEDHQQPNARDSLHLSYCTYLTSHLVQHLGISNNQNISLSQFRWLIVRTVVSSLLSRGWTGTGTRSALALETAASEHFPLRRWTLQKWKSRPSKLQDRVSAPSIHFLLCCTTVGFGRGASTWPWADLSFLLFQSELRVSA